MRLPGMDCYRAPNIFVFSRFFHKVPGLSVSHKIKKDLSTKLRGLVPFGLADRKPHHFRDMASILWQNRDNLGYAWKVITRGVCDGCALGVAGLHDWTIQGTHLCM